VNKLLRILLKDFKGETPLYIFAEKEKQSLRMSKELWVDIEKGASEFLIKKFGEENVKIVNN